MSLSQALFALLLFSAQAHSEILIERVVDTYAPSQPQLHLYLRMPLDYKPLGVLAFCTWNSDRQEIINELSDANGIAQVKYAESHHLALLTWNTARAWGAKSADQQNSQTNVSEHAQFGKLADSWERGVRSICKDTNLPQSDFLLYGISRGAQWAHRLALRKPKYFLAVHVHINSSYDTPDISARNVLWLQTTGDLEVGYEAAKRFYFACRKLEFPIIFKAGEILGHADSEQIAKMDIQFFDWALSIKEKKEALAAC